MPVAASKVFQHETRQSAADLQDAVDNGQGRQPIRCGSNNFQPASMAARRASSGVRDLGDAGFTSAPARNPESFLLRKTTNFGVVCSKSSTIRANSANTSSENRLTGDPAASNQTVTMPRSSRSIEKW